MMAMGIIMIGALSRLSSEIETNAMSGVIG